MIKITRNREKRRLLNLFGDFLFPNFKLEIVLFYCQIILANLNPLFIERGKKEKKKKRSGNRTRLSQAWNDQTKRLGIGLIVFNDWSLTLDRFDYIRDISHLIWCKGLQCTFACRVQGRASLYLYLYLYLPTGKTCLYARSWPCYGSWWKRKAFGRKHYMLKASTECKCLEL